MQCVLTARGKSQTIRMDNTLDISPNVEMRGAENIQETAEQGKDAVVCHVVGVQ